MFKVNTVSLFVEQGTRNMLHYKTSHFSVIVGVGLTTFILGQWTTLKSSSIAFTVTLTGSHMVNYSEGVASMPMADIW